MAGWRRAWGDRALLIGILPWGLGCGGSDLEEERRISAAVMDSVAQVSVTLQNDLASRSPQAAERADELDRLLLRHLRLKRSQGVDELGGVQWQNLYARDNLKELRAAVLRENWDKASVALQKIGIRCRLCHEEYNERYLRREGHPNPRSEAMAKAVDRILQPQRGPLTRPGPGSD